MGVKDRYNQKKKEAETEEEEKTGVRERYLARNGEERKESSVSDGSVTLGGKTYKKREALDVDGYEAKRKQEITAEKSAKSAASVSEQKMVLDDIGSRVLTTVQNATQKRSVNTSNLYTTEEEKKRLMALQSILDEEDKDKTEEGNKAMPSNLSDAVMEAEKNSVNPLSEQIKTFQENATPSGISEEAISYNPREWNQNAVREKIAENEKKNYEENIVPKVKAFTETAKNGTALDKAGAIATSLIFAGDSGLGSARDFLNLVKNDDGNIENTPEYWRRKSLTALRDSVQGEAIESKFGKEAYNIAYSIVDSVTESLYTSPVSYLGAGGKVASLTSAIGMGGSAALDTYIDMRERGVDSDSAKIGAFLSGVGEGLFESVSLGHFTEAWTGAASRTMKEWFVKQLVSAGVNGSEEFFTEIWDGIIDLATDPEKSKYAEFYNSGVENGGSSASGFRNAFMNGILPDAGYSFVTGAIQGGLMTAGQIGASALINGTERSNAIAEMKANGMSTNEAKKTYKIVKEIRMEAASASNDKGKISKFNQNVASVSENPVQTTENTETSAQNNAQDSQSMNVSNDTENVQTSQNAKESVTDGNANTGEKVNTDVYARNGNEVSKVDVKSIEYEKNGRAKLVSENGESVYLNETEFANEDVRDIFAIMADDKKSASEIKAASANYAESVNGRNVSVTEYLRSFTAYEEGASAGLKLEEIESQPKVKSVFSENMTDAAKTAAYNVGASKRFSKPGLTMLTQRTYRQQDASVKRQIDIIGNMAKANGLHFVITDDLGGNNGLYKENSNTIAISLDAEGYFRDSDGKKVPLLTRTAGHEVYHFVERFNEKAAADIREEVLGFIRNTRGEEYLNEIRNTYKENGYSENLIDSEITADAMFDAFSDERTVEKLVKKDRNLVEKVKEFIDKVLADIRNAIAELRKQDKVMDVFADETEELQKISSMLQNALSGAKSEFAKADNVEIVNSIRESKAYMEKHVENLEKFDFSDSSVDKKELLKRYERVAEIWDSVSRDLAYEFLDKWNAQDEHTKRAFDVFKKQTGYKFNMELSSMCKKGLALFEAIDSLVHDGVLDRFGEDFVFGKAEKEILYDILKEKGFDIPCAVCYVEQARQREGQIIKDFLDGRLEDGKIGWNSTISAIEKMMTDDGNPYTFRTADESLSSEMYQPKQNAPMTDSQLESFNKALVYFYNKEIDRYNETHSEDKHKSHITTISKSTVKKVGAPNPAFRLLKELATNTSYVQKFKPFDLYSSFATKNLSTYHKALYSLFNEQGGVNGYKTKQRPVAYLGDLLRKKTWTSSSTLLDNVRNQSNSDLQMYTFFDQVQMIIDATVKGLYWQGYTKVIEELKLLGLSNVKMNASAIPLIMAYTDGDGKVDAEKTRLNAGLDKDGNLLFDTVEGISVEEVRKLLGYGDYSKNVGIICIGFSDNHIKKLLDTEWIQQIIGYHDKSNDLAKRYRKAEYATNYNGKNETVDGKGKTIHSNFNEFIVKAEKMFKGDRENGFSGTAEFNVETYLTRDIPKLAADLYLDMCRKNGYTPAYNIEGIVDHPNYYKLLADYSLKDKEGNYAPQRKAAFKLPEQVPSWSDGDKLTMVSTEEYIRNALGAELKTLQDISDAVDDKSSDGLVNQFYERVKAKRESKGDSAETSRRESRKVTAEEDAEYLKLAENPKENEARLREMVDDTAKKNGYPVVAYHGTRYGGFTKFEKDSIGKNTGVGRGRFSFTTEKNTAKEYAKGDNSISGRDIIGRLNKLFKEYSSKELNSILNFGEDETTPSWDFDFIDEINEYVTVSKEDFMDEDFELDRKAYNSALRSDEANATVKYIREQMNQYKEEADGKHDKFFNAVEKMLNEYDKTDFKNSVYSVYLPSPDSVYYADENSYNDVAWDASYDDADVVEVKLNSGESRFFVRNPESIKSADLVTYDDNGNIIPLSERFNSEDEDIRYQKKMSNGDKDKKIKSLSKEVNRLNKDNAEMKDRLNAISEDFKTADKKFPSEDKMNELSKKLIEGKKAKLSPSQISKRLVSFINNLYSGESNDAFSEAADIAFDILGDESASDILDMAEEIMRSLVNDIPEVKTSLGIRYNAARRRVIELTDTIRKNKEKYKDALVKAKDALVKANRKYEEYRENESRETYITKITDKLENLQERLDKPNVKSLKYVPTNAVNAVKTILEAFNHAEGEKVTADWQNALRSVIEGADGSVDKDGKARLLIPDKSVEAIKKFLGEVSAYEAKTGTKVTDPLTMDSSKLKELNSAIYVIEKAVSNLVYGIRGNNRKTIADTASEFYIGIPRNPLKVGIGRQYAEYNLRNMKPVYLFKAMGENGRRFFYDTLATGDERYARNIAKVQKGIDSIVSNAGDGDEAKGRKQIEAWRTHINEIKLDSGRTIYMTDMELADFYLQFGNGEDAFLHFTEGGISLSQSESDLKDIFKKSKSAYDFRRSNNEPIPLTSIDGQSNMSKEEIKEIIREKKENGDFRVSGDVARILSIVEKNNGLKSFAEDMRKYVFETLAPMGNDVTQRIWGVDLFTQGETYWSIKALKAKSLQNQVANMGSIYTLMNPSFSKSRVEGANSPIQIDSAFGGLINIGYKMSLYNGYSAEMYDFIRVLDTEVSTGKTLADAMSESLGLSQSSGMNVSKYIVKLIQDIAGASQRRDSEAFYKSWKLSNVTWNARVAVQQAMSLTRAVPYLGKYMVQNPSSAFMLKEFKEATQYSGIALEKSMEHYDTGTSRGIGEKYDMSKSAYRKTVENISDIGLVGAEYFDKFAWGVMWNACKKKVKTENPKIEAGSKDYFAKVSDTFREVIYETQVADGVLQKSDMMRGDRFDRMLSNYMAEPTTTLNMWNDAVRVLKNKNHSKEAKSFARKRIATIIIGNTLMATVVSAFDATARDDDDDETWLEKFVQAMFGDYDLSEGFVKNVNAFFSANLVEQFNPLSYATGIFNIVNSALKGFTAESLDMGMIEGITDFIEYVEKSIEKSESLGDVAKAVWNAPAYIKKAVLGSIDMVMGGVGLKNMYRDVNFVKSVFGVESDSYSYDETGTADVLKAYSTGDTVKFRETYDKYIAEMTEEGKSLEDCQRNVRNRVWREYKAEYYEARESVSGRLYEIENIFDDFEIPDSKRNDEYFTYKREKYSLTAEDIASEICNGSTKKWNQLLDAVGDSYKDLNAEEKKDKRDNQKSAVTRFVKAAYLSSTDKRVMRAKIVSTKLYTEEQVTGWEKENE